jgi:hypothetical protein
MQVDLDTRSLRLHSMVTCGSGAVATIAWSVDSEHIVAVCDKTEAPPGAAAPDTTVLQCSPANPNPSPITTGPGSVNAIVWTLDGEHVVSTDRSQHLVCASVLAPAAATVDSLVSLFLVQHSTKPLTACAVHS